MNKLFLLICCVAVIGCAHKPKPAPVQYSAPTGYVKVSEHVQKAIVSNDQAKAKVEAIKVNGAKPNDPAVAEVLNVLTNTALDLGNAQPSIEEYKKQVQAQTTQLSTAVTEKNTALEQVEYWHGKHTDAVWKIWYWRAASAILAAAIIMRSRPIKNFRAASGSRLSSSPEEATERVFQDRQDTSTPATCFLQGRTSCGPMIFTEASACGPIRTILI